MKQHKIYLIALLGATQLPSHSEYFFIYFVEVCILYRYFETSHLTEKSDVYGFGVVLLELVCGREAIDRTQHDRGQVVLVEWVSLHLLMFYSTSH